MSQFFTQTDYVMCLPIILLTLFAVGILLIDLTVPAEWKWSNAVTAFVGVLFAAGGVYRIQTVMNRTGNLFQPAVSGAIVIDHFSIYFFYLFLAGAAVSIL